MRHLLRRLGARIEPLEALEPRMLLSAWSLSTYAAFNGDNGSEPFAEELTLDSAGDIFGATSSGGAFGNGLIYEIPAGSQTITPIASFTGANGGDPVGRLLLDSAGNIYGVTSGGDVNEGSVFVIPHGTHSIATIATFDGANGAYPIGLTMDAAGNLYGVTQNEGAFSEGNVFEIAKGSGTVTVLGSFNGTNGAVPESNLLIDAAGNIFGATEQGGANGSGALFEIPASTGSLITVASFDANGDNGESPMGDLVMDASGDIFGTAQFGGAFNGGQNGNGTVFELASGASIITAYASFATADGINPFGGLLLDSAGNIYGTTTNGGTNGAGTIFEIAADSNAISVLASLPGPYGSVSAGNLVLDSAGDLLGTMDGGGIPTDDGIVFELSPTTATHLVFSQGPAKTVAGQDISTITVEVQDDSGRVISNDQSAVSLVLASNPDAAVLGGTTTVNAIDGVATFTSVWVSATGRYTLQASDGDLTPALSDPFTIVPSPLTPLAAFDSTTGGNAIGRPVMDSEGNLFGVTTTGGANGGGMIVELQKGASILTPVAAFDDSTGEIPAGGLFIDAHGNLLGLTTSGGGGSGTLFELPAGGSTILPLAGFSSTTPIGSLVMDSAGDLFGLTTTGDDDSDGTLFEFPASSGSLITLASLSGISGSNPSTNLVIDEAGDLFLATTTGGTSGDGALMEFPATGNALVTLASFTTADGIAPGSLVSDSAGNIYGITSSGGDNNLGTLFVLPAGSDNLAVLASFDPATGAPSSLAIDAHGNLIGTAGNGLFESVADSDAITPLIALTSATGAGPTALLVDPAGNIFGATTAGDDNDPGMFFRYANAPATHLAFTIEPVSTIAGQSLSSITVVDADGDGYPVPSDDAVITLSINSGPGGAVLQGIPTAILQNGYATFSDLTLSPTGAYTLAASDGVLPIAASTSFSINPILPQDNSVKLAFSGEPADAIAGATLASFTVTIEDAQGQIVTTDNSSITLQIASGPPGATIQGTLIAQAQNGVATFSGLALDTAGTYRLFASDASLLAATSARFTIHPAAPAHLVFQQDPSDALAGAVISPAVSIALTDSFGNPITSSHAAITLSIHSGPGAPIKGSVSATLINGQATFRNLSLTTAGTYTLAAAGASLATTSDPFIISPATAAKLVFLEPPSSAAAGVAISPAINVALIDRYGNLVTTAQSLITLALPSGPKSAALSGNVALPLDNGSASFGAISLAAAGTYKLKARGDGFTVTSTAISITSLVGAHPRAALVPLAAIPWL